MSARSLIGGVEAGGTKFVCALGYEDGGIERVESFPTRDPDATIEDCLAFFRSGQEQLGRAAAIGVASFGPLILDPDSPEHGALSRTPKPGWSGVNIRQRVAEALGLPVEIDTDVNGAGLAEARLGAGKGLDCVAYLTVGTGIGGGLIVDGKPVHGRGHPEMGHLLVRRHPADQDFPGACPFHGDCLEGLASGAAILRRQGHSLSGNAAGDPLRDIVADYLAQLCASLVLIASPRRIIVGGGVMSAGGLLPMVREMTLTKLNFYLAGLETPADAAGLIVPPALGDRAGVTGALLLGALRRP